MSIFSIQERSSLTIAQVAPAQQAVISQVIRKPVKDRSASEESKQLALEALEVLGYDVLSRQVLTPLGDVLRRLEIDILDEPSVLKYMASITRRHKDEGWNWVPLDAKSADAWNYARNTIYSAPIPEFVLRKAIQIRKALPEVSLFVRTVEANPDPFLWAGLRHFDNYYIEVWDEPKFEGRSQQ
jgi:hypothetical protein